MKVRGYLLAEAAVAGSLLAVTIITTLTLIATSRTDEQYAANRGIAASLARAKADELSSDTVAGCAPGDQAAFTTVSATYPAFKWKWTVVAAPNTASSTPPIAAGTLCDIDLRVQFPAQRGGKDDVADGTVDSHGVVHFRRLY